MVGRYKFDTSSLGTSKTKEQQQQQQKRRVIVNWPICYAHMRTVQANSRKRQIAIF